MRPWLRLADGIDRFNEGVGRVLYWLTLVMVLVGSYNAIVRYLAQFASGDPESAGAFRKMLIAIGEVAVPLNSNGFIELQWYLFSLLFLLGAAYTLKHNAHVRVDVLYGRLSAKGKAWINLLGTVLFLIPFCVLMLWTAWPADGAGRCHADPANRHPARRAARRGACRSGGGRVMNKKGEFSTPDRSPGQAFDFRFLMDEEGVEIGRWGNGRWRNMLFSLTPIALLAGFLLFFPLPSSPLPLPSDWLAPLMFIAALALIFSGYPVAFALGGTALLFAFIGVEAGYFDWHLLLAMPDRTFGVMSNFVLLAVPFFIFMGTMLEKSRLAEDLLKTIGLLFGPVRGGLALAVVFVGALLAAATGVVGASVVAMGMISLPVMLRYGYSKELSAGVITASGTLGQIIPPSVVLVVLADQLGISVGDLFVGSLVPGILLAGLYAVYVGGVAIFRPKAAPALPKEVRDIKTGELLRRVLLSLMPPLVLILVVLGSIFAGVATPTEAGALGALGAMILAALNRRLTRKALRETMDETTKLTAMVMLLLIGSTAFALVFRGLDGDLWIEGLLTNLPGGVIGFLIIANLAIFVLGFFIDFFEIAFIIIPLLVAPAAQLLVPGFGASESVALVWFGVMVGMNLQTSFLTPPFGFALFYLRGVAPPEVTTAQIYRGVIPFIIIQLIGLLALILFPGLVTWAL
jgi:tripartite ATP-independent transporter DctM subunit